MKHPAAPRVPFSGWTPPINRTRPGKHVLDLEKLNLGTSEIIRSPGGTEPKVGDLVKLLDVTGDDRLARTFSIIMGATFLQPDFPPGQLITGPLSAIVEFGNGAAFARIEFDIPFLSRIPSMASAAAGGTANQFKSPFFSGTSLTVSGSAIRVYARNDNNLRAIAGADTIIGVDPSQFGIVEPTVFAHISYDKIFGANKALFKSIYGVNQASATDLEPGEFIRMGIPPFAKEVLLYRTPFQTTQLDVDFISFAQGPGTSSIRVPVNDAGPLPVPPWANEMVLLNASAVENITSLTATFILAV